MNPLEGNPFRTRADAQRAVSALFEPLVPAYVAGGARVSLGTTAEQLVRSAPVPVLLATNAHDAAPHDLLVPVNDSAIASSVVRWARFLTRYFHAEATALHVLGPPVFTSAAV